MSLAGLGAMSSSEGSSSIPVSGLDMGRGSPRRGSSEEPRLAFIGCETTSTLSSPLSLSGGHHGGKSFANVLTLRFYPKNGICIKNSIFV